MSEFKDRVDSILVGIKTWPNDNCKYVVRGLIIDQQSPTN